LKIINLERTFKLIPNYDTPARGSTQRPAGRGNHTNLPVSGDTRFACERCALEPAMVVSFARVERQLA
jgi:hypothetical protein